MRSLEGSSGGAGDDGGGWGVGGGRVDAREGSKSRGRTGFERYRGSLLRLGREVVEWLASRMPSEKEMGLGVIDRFGGSWEDHGADQGL